MRFEHRGDLTLPRLEILVALLQLLDLTNKLRRMALLAWIGTHIDTRLAQTHVEGFAAGTAELAERYLRGPLWS